MRYTAVSCGVQQTPRLCFTTRFISVTKRMVDANTNTPMRVRTAAIFCAPLSDLSDTITRLTVEMGITQNWQRVSTFVNRVSFVDRDACEMRYACFADGELYNGIANPGKQWEYINLVHISSQHLPPTHQVNA